MRGLKLKGPPKIKIPGMAQKFILYCLLVGFVIGGGSMLFMQTVTSNVEAVKQQVLTTAKSKNFTGQKLTVTVKDNETTIIKESELRYDENFQPSFHYEGDVYREANGIIFKNDREPVPYLPFLDGSFVFLALIDKEVDVSPTEGTYNVFAHLKSSGLSVKEIKFGPTNAPSFLLEGDVKKEDSLFLAKNFSENIGVTIPESESYHVKIILNKRLGTIEEILIEANSNFAIHLNYSSL